MNNKQNNNEKVLKNSTEYYHIGEQIKKRGKHIDHLIHDFNREGQRVSPP